METPPEISLEKEIVTRRNDIQPSVWERYEPSGKPRAKRHARNAVNDDRIFIISDTTDCKKNFSYISALPFGLPAASAFEQEQRPLTQLHPAISQQPSVELVEY